MAAVLRMAEDMNNVLPNVLSLATPLMLPTVLLSLLAGACATRGSEQPPQQVQLTRAISAPARLEPPAHLPAEARELLRTRMASHARDMADLMSAVMILRYDQVAERAQAIAGEAHFARPLTGDASELNAALPEQFFAQDRQLRVWAGALATAAENLDAFAVANAYGELSETCVSCHAAYRAGK
jgi:cytochrome c556